MITDKQIADAVVHLTMEGIGAPTIAKRLGITPNQVYGIRKREMPLPPTHISRLFRRKGAQEPLTTPEVDLLVSMHREGVGYDDIAASLDTTRQNVIAHLRKRGVQPALAHRLWRLAEYDYLLEHADQSNKEIGKALHRTPGAVARHYAKLRDMGFNIPDRRRRAEDAAKSP